MYFLGNVFLMYYFIIFVYESISLLHTISVYVIEYFPGNYIDLEK